MSWKQVYNSRMFRAPVLIALGIGLIAIACRKQEETPPAAAAAEEKPAPEIKTAEPSVAASAQEAPAADEERAPAAAASILIKDAGFETPESVLFDDAADRYLVSNINGNPAAEDNNGFISQIAPDGRVSALKWIEGGQNGITLNAPKGMTLRGEILYVTDIYTVRMFNRNTGASVGDIPVKGAVFLNDLSTAPNGTIYLSDSGVKVTEKGFVSTGKDAVYRIDAENKVTKLIGGKGLNQPNGLLAEVGGVWVAAMGGNELYRVSDDGKRGASVKVPGGSLDGLVRTNDGQLMVSSWEAATLYTGSPAGPFTASLAGVTSPADIGYDAKRNRVLIPVFEENAVRIQPVASGVPTSGAAATASAQPGTAAGATTEGEAAATAANAPEGSKGLRTDAPEPETAASKADPNAASDAPASKRAPASPNPAP